MSLKLLNHSIEFAEDLPKYQLITQPLTWEGMITKRFRVVPLVLVKPSVRVKVANRFSQRLQEEYEAF